MRRLLIAFLLLSACAFGQVVPWSTVTPAGGTFALAQEKNPGNVETQTSPITLSLPSTTAKLIAVTIISYLSAADTISVADDLSNSYTLAKTCGGSSSIRFFYFANNTAGSRTLTVSWTQPTGTWVWASAREITSTTTASLDQTSCGDLVTTASNVAVIAAVADETNQSGVGSGWLDFTHVWAASVGGGVEDKFNLGAGTYSPTFTGAVPGDYGYVVGAISFKN